MNQISYFHFFSNLWVNLSHKATAEAEMHSKRQATMFCSKGSLLYSSEIDMGWDGIYFGYGVTTALMIVQWPTAFLPRHSAHRVGRVIPKKNHPHSRSRSNPTIVQYLDFGEKVAQVTKVPQLDAQSQRKQGEYTS